MLDNNRTAIIRSHKASYAKNHNQYSKELLTAVLGNEPDFESGRDDGEVFEPKKVEPYVNNEIELIEESIKNNTQIIY